MTINVGSREWSWHKLGAKCGSRVKDWMHYGLGVGVEGRVGLRVGVMDWSVGE